MTTVLRTMAREGGATVFAVETPDGTTIGLVHERGDRCVPMLRVHKGHAVCLPVEPGRMQAVQAVVRANASLAMAARAQGAEGVA